MRLLLEDLLRAFIIATILVGGCLVLHIHQQGNLRIDASQDFSRISIGMSKVDVQKLTNWDHLTCQDGWDEVCHFRDFRRVYSVEFDHEGRVMNKRVVFRDILPRMMEW